MSDKPIPDQLSSVATIIGELGANIAEAQKQLDANYVRSLTQVLGQLADASGRKAAVEAAEEALKNAGADAEKKKKAEEALVAAKNLTLPAGTLDLIKAIGPSRYQFTETTLKVRLDLSRSLDVVGSLGVGAGFGAVTVNAALTVGYAYDYQAAAECTTVLHAVPASESVLKTLLDRAKEVDGQKLTLPARSAADDKLVDQLKALSTALKTPKAP